MDINSLSVSERILLAQELWDSIHDRSDEIEVSPEQMKMLEERLAAYHADGDPGDSWENVRARIENT
ncbi:MAG: addiction module protein [Gammaproteobacteria bacterium]|nr:addiction module protein [Gammaproteobacteria bacterium]